LRYPVFDFPGPPHPQLYPLSLHDALPISQGRSAVTASGGEHFAADARGRLLAELVLVAGGARPEIAILESGNDVPWAGHTARYRSEEHTSELQSREKLVCRLRLEKKKEKQ